MSERSGPIAVLLADHVQGRDYIGQMDRATAAGPDYVAFAHGAQGYSSLMKGHIQKENNVLFPMAEEMLDKCKLEKLYTRFEEHEEKVIGHGRHEELHAILEGLHTKYAI